ncbi:MAG: RluA family pseudouridine synthase [Nitrospirota bacterium]
MDIFVSGKTGITRSQIQRLIEQGNILVNDKKVSQSYKTKAGDTVSIMIIVKERADELIPEPLPLDILHQDDHLVVVNKPASMVVYPAAGHYRGTLMNAIAFYCRNLASAGGPLRPGVAHRLDKDTSGVMVVALSDEAYYSLVEQFKQRKVNRSYIALIYGNLKKDEGEITFEIGRSVSDRKKMSTRVRKGKAAITRWKVLERFGIATLIEVKLGTGRTHQIRVHFSSIGHPVLGDRTYGRKSEVEIKGREKITFPRQMLHAASLGFFHSPTGTYMEFSSPLPDDMAEKVGELRAIAGQGE